MVYILSSGKIVPDTDPRALAAQGRQSDAAKSGSSNSRRQGGLGTMGGMSSQGAGARGGTSSFGGAAQNSTGGARNNGQNQHGNNAAEGPAWLAPGSTLGDINARLVEQVPPQLTAVAPPVIMLGAVLAYALAGPQAAVIVALVYFFSTQQQRQQQ